jgi:protein SCO1
MIRQLSNSKFLIPAMLVLAILAAGTGFYISLKQSQNQLRHNPGIEGLFWPNPKLIQEFNTLDQSGNQFGLDQMNGKWSFIFFGYTHCPDVCPVTMSVMADAYKQLAVDNKELQIIFVTVDPERDTRQILSQYVSYYNEKIIGLGGTIDMVNSLTTNIGVPYYLNNEEQTENYLVDHSASIFLIDPKGRMVGKLSPPHQKDKIIQQFTKIKNFIDEQS